MSKIVLISDQHFGVRNDSSVFLDFQERFYRDTFFPFIDQNNIKTVINLGDSFDRRKFINYGSLKRAKDMFFNELLVRDIWSPTIIGNHDSFFSNTITTNSVRLLLGDYTNLTIIEEAQTLEVDGIPICMVPWICVDNADRCFSEMNTTRTDLCMGHFEISGFVMNQGQVSEKGLDRSVFERFDMVFSGHYHHRSTDGTIYYLGAPNEMTWIDFEDVKGFHTFDLETRELDFIPNPNKMFHKITYNEDVKKLPHFDQYTGTYVKVVVEKRSDMKKFLKFMEKLYDFGPININIVENFIDVIELPEMVLNQANDTPTLLEHYIDNTNVPEDIQKEKLKAVFRNIYDDSLVMEE